MHEPTPPISVPVDLARTVTEFFGPDWADALPEMTAHRCDLWELRPTGDAPMHGALSLVVPVERADGTPAVLKMQPVDEETRGEPVALAAWAGEGTVRLLEHDPGTGAMLLEPLDPARSLYQVEMTEALSVIGGLLARLNARPGPAGIRHLGPMTLRLVERSRPFLCSERVGDGLRRRLAAWTAVAGEMAPEPGDRLLHWDLHFENVLAPLPGFEREPWLAIDPKSLVGDPGYELLPALRNRFAEEAGPGGVARSVRRRFDLLTEAAGLDRERARAWTLVRVLEDCMWKLEDGHFSGFDTQVAIADALSG